MFRKILAYALIGMCIAVAVLYLLVYVMGCMAIHACMKICSKNAAIFS